MLRNFILVFFLLLHTAKVWGQDVIVYPSKLKFIGKQTLVFEDKLRQYSFQEIISNPEWFEKSKNDVVFFGVNNYDNWVKFVIKNESNHDNILVNIPSPQIDFVSFYYIIDNRKDSFSIASYSPISMRAIQHPNFVFSVPITKGQTAECYLKFSSNKQMSIPIQVLTDVQLVSVLSVSDSISALFIGVMLAMILYNLFIFINYRERHYLYYCNYIFWVAFTQLVLSGLAQYILFFENEYIMHKLLTFSAIMSGLGTGLFALSFLKIKELAPKYYPFVLIFIILEFACIGLLFLNYDLLAYNLLNVIAGIGSFLLLFIAFKIHQKNYKPARFFLLGFTFFLGSVVVFVLKDFGVLPYNEFTIRSVQIGSLFESMLLSFALADQMNILKKEKELSQLQALQAAQKNEKLITEQNMVLEQKVNERTYELKTTNEDLNTTLENLKQAQSQLVESEKMASLGQLTAGIAHEINNPINFVTSNVAPLKRDVIMVFDTIDFIEKTWREDISVEEKKLKIEAYKEELDYDYLKIEINHLLKGIYEGSSRTAEIVKGLRIFSRVDENDLKRADINEGIESTLIIANNQLNSTIKVVKDYSQNLPLIECYPGKLNQVFLNLISNAIHAIRIRHGESENGIITIRTKGLENDISIEILDNGAGMDENTQHKIYEPFFTTKEVGEGTGLGMSIVYNTIKKHNGYIKLVSEVGVGTSFTITLPIIHQLNIEQ